MPADPAWRQHCLDELDAAYLYRALARVERNDRRRSIFERLATVEDQHVERWRTIFRDHGSELPAFTPTLRSRGLMCGQRFIEPPRRAVVPAIAFVIGWPAAMGLFDWQWTFPFMTLSGLPAAGFVLLGHIREHGVARFFARNTVIVFIAHMPLYYLLEFLLLDAIPSYATRVSLEFLICFLGLAFTSEAVRCVVDLRPLRDRLVTATVPMSAGGRA